MKIKNMISFFVILSCSFLLNACSSGFYIKMAETNAKKIPSSGKIAILTDNDLTTTGILADGLTTEFLSLGYSVIERNIYNEKTSTANDKERTTSALNYIQVGEKLGVKYLIIVNQVPFIVEGAETGAGRFTLRFVEIETGEVLFSSILINTAYGDYNTFIEEYLKGLKEILSGKKEYFDNSVHNN